LPQRDSLLVQILTITNLPSNSPVILLTLLFSSALVDFMKPDDREKYSGTYGEDFRISYVLPTDFDGFADLAISIDGLESVLKTVISVSSSGAVR